MRYQNPIFSFYDVEYTPLLHTYSREYNHIKVQISDYINEGALKGQRESCDFIWFDIVGDRVVCQLNEQLNFPVSDYPELEQMIKETV